MQIDVNKLIEVYQNELQRLMNENLILKTQLIQLEEEVRRHEGNIKE